MAGGLMVGGLEREIWKLSANSQKCPWEKYESPITEG